jgi:hypothetical protein
MAHFCAMSIPAAVVTDHPRAQATVTTAAQRRGLGRVRRSSGDPEGGEGEAALEDDPLGGGDDSSGSSSADGGVGEGVDGAGESGGNGSADGEAEERGAPRGPEPFVGRAGDGD